MKAMLLKHRKKRNREGKKTKDPIRATQIYINP